MVPAPGRETWRVFFEGALFEGKLKGNHHEITKEQKEASKLSVALSHFHDKP